MISRRRMTTSTTPFGEAHGCLRLSAWSPDAYHRDDGAVEDPPLVRGEERGRESQTREWHYPGRCILTTSPLQNLDELVNDQDKQQRRERIALDYHIYEANLPYIFLRPVRQTDLPPRHHLDDEHLDTKGESIGIQELFQEGMVQVAVCLLEIKVHLHDIFISFLCRVRGNVLYHCLLAPLGRADTSLFVFYTGSHDPGICKNKKIKL